MLPKRTSEIARSCAWHAVGIGPGAVARRRRGLSVRSPRISTSSRPIIVRLAAALAQAYVEIGEMKRAETVWQQLAEQKPLATSW